MAIKTIALASLALMATTIGIYFMMNDTKTEKTYLRQFIEHGKRYNKQHSTKEEMEYRYAVYTRNMKMIEEHNAKNKSFKMAENKFSDLTFDEFKSKYLSSQILHNKRKFFNEGELEKGHKDWKKERKVTRVKDQAACGSCWAFSVTGSLESAYAIFKKKNIEASEQELVDCSGDYGNYGCNGGLMTSGFEYIKDHKISTEKDYPYKAFQNSCKAKKFKSKYQVKGYSLLKPTDVTGLVKGLKKQPVSVAIEVQSDFMHYHSGVYHNEYCGDGLNHGVLAVAYYTDVEDPYFLVKNSWGEDWGDNGYIKMAVGKGSGTCGIANNWDVIPQV